MSDQLIVDNILKETGKSNSCYSIYIIGMTCDKYVIQLKKKLDKINKSIKDNYKRKQANDIIYSFLNHLESNLKGQMLNCIFLVNHDDIITFNLSEKDLRVASEWNIKEEYFTYDNHFKIDYLYNLFNDESYINVFRMNNKSLKVYQINQTKSRLVDEIKSMNSENLLDMYSKYKLGYIVGVSSFIKKFPEKFKLIKGNITNDVILEDYENQIILENQIKLNEMVLAKMSIEEESDKFVFGRNKIVSEIENYMIKYLFITPKLHNLLKNNIDTSLINFDIFEVKKIECGDYGHILIRDYGGMVGIKYY